MPRNLSPCLFFVIAGVIFLVSAASLGFALAAFLRRRDSRRPPPPAPSPTIPVHVDLSAQDAPGQTFWGGAYDDEMRPESRVPGHLFAAPEPRRYPPEAPTAPVRQVLSADAPAAPMRPPPPPGPETTLSTTRSRIEGLRDGIHDPAARHDLDEALDRDLKEGTWPKSQAVPKQFQVRKKGDIERE